MVAVTDALETTVEWRRAADLAQRLASEHGVTLTVRVLPSELALDRWGAARNTVVYLHRGGVPAFVIAHEVAHALGSPTEAEHGPEWRERCSTLTTRLRNFL